MAKKIEMTSTGVHIIDGLFMRVLGQDFRLRDYIYNPIKSIDPKRLVAVIRQCDLPYNETFLGYVWKFIPDCPDALQGTIVLGCNDSGEGSYTPIRTKDIIGWCYLDNVSDE